MADSRFLAALASPAPRRSLEQTVQRYRPLLGIWLIDLALLLTWHRPRRNGGWADIFTDDDFCLLTGLRNPQWHAAADDEDEFEGGQFTPSSPSLAGCRRILLRQRALLQGEKLPRNLHLFRNVQLLGKMLGLTEADQAVLVFAVLLQVFPQFRRALSSRTEDVSHQVLCQTLSAMMGIPEAEFAASLSEEGMLNATSLVRVNHYPTELGDKLDLMEGFGNILMARHATFEGLTRHVLRKAAAPTLGLENFPHIASDSAALTGYLRNAIDQGTAGVNILLHGKPGVGKTEYVQALAAGLGIELYEIAFSDSSGNPIKGEMRLRAYNLCQRLLARSGNALLLFDEVEDVFPDRFSFLSLFFGDREAEGGGRSAGKAWINRTMERNPVPAIWVSNQVDQIDAAYKRRFDYSIRFQLPPLPVRLSIAGHHLGRFQPPQHFLERIAANEQITPGQLAVAAKVAGIASPDDQARALLLVEQTLERSMSLMGKKGMPGRSAIRTGYSLDYLNTDVEVGALVGGLTRRPRGSFCFYGAAGTGKSELARHLADRIGKPFLLRRASEVLDMYVGQTEKNIAAMFEDAHRQDAVLVLDEADSFLADRRDAQRSWELTQVNELLTQMEAFEGVFICTTNLMQKLDPASLRRFAFKVRFDPLRPEQRSLMFRQELLRLGGEPEPGGLHETRVRELAGLTPGDFAVAARQFELWGVPATGQRLYATLRAECEAKGATRGAIGFGKS